MYSKKYVDNIKAFTGYLKRQKKYFMNVKKISLTIEINKLDLFLSFLITIIIAFSIIPPKFSSKTILTIPVLDKAYTSKEIAKVLAYKKSRFPNIVIENYETTYSPKNDNQIILIVTGDTILETQKATELEINNAMAYISKINEDQKYLLLKKIEAYKKYLKYSEVIMRDIIKPNENLSTPNKGIQTFIDKNMNYSIDLAQLEFSLTKIIEQDVFISDSFSTTIRLSSILFYILIFTMTFLVVRIITSLPSLIQLLNRKNDPNIN